MFAVALTLSRPCSAQAQDTSGWKTLTSKGGWTIEYPASWQVWSCHSCPDPTAPNVYVSFGNLSPNGPLVMVEPLADKPLNEDIEQWLNRLKGTNNLNPIVSADSISIKGLRGLRVKYKTAGNTPMEETYLVSGSRTFAISLATAGSRELAIYQQMVSTFAVKAR